MLINHISKKINVLEKDVMSIIYIYIDRSSLQFDLVLILGLDSEFEIYISILQ